MEDNPLTAGYSPNRYIKTGHGTFLAILKALELAALVVAAFSILQSLGAVKQTIGLSQSIMGLTGQASGTGYDSILKSIGIGTSFMLWVELIGICLFILDAASAILLRVTGRFSGMIRFIHTIIFIVMLLGLALLLLVIYEWIRVMTSGCADLAALLQMTNLYLIAFLLAGIAINLPYHSGIISIMKTIGRERRTGEMRSIKPSQLPGFCNGLIWWSVLSLIFLVATYIVPNVVSNNTTRGLLKGYMGYVKAYESVFLRDAIIEAATLVFFVIKYATIKACAKDYNNAH